MDKIKILPSAAFLLLVCEASMAQTRTVVITADGHVVPAKKQTVLYSGLCAERKYEMEVAQAEGRIRLVLQGTQVDLSASAFANTYLTRPTAGRFVFACLDKSVYINYWGVELPSGKPLQAINYRLTANFDGNIEEDSGPQQVEPEQLRQMIQAANGSKATH